MVTTVTLMPSVSGLVFVLGAEMTNLGAAERALNFAGRASLHSPHTQSRSCCLE